MKSKPLPSLERILQSFRYDEKTGRFFWARNVVGGNGGIQKRIGDNAGSCGANGYMALNIDGMKYLAHRVAWYLVYGFEPNCIDHINGNKLDNRIVNLRNVTKSQNGHNRSAQRNSSSGIRGIGWDRERNKWRVQLKVGEKRFIRRFDTLDEAKLAHLGAVTNMGVLNFVKRPWSSPVVEEIT